MEMDNYHEKLRLVKYVSKELTQKLLYHNFRHENAVYLASMKLANLERVSYEKAFLLGTAALLHDIKDNEERGAEFAKEYLPKVGYSSEQARKIAYLIIATKIPQKPRNLLERIICDADLAYLGSSNFFEWSEKLRKELGIQNKKEWYEKEAEFLQNHQYHTESAKEFYDKIKKRNIEKLKRIAGGKLKC